MFVRLTVCSSIVRNHARSMQRKGGHAWLGRSVVVFSNASRSGSSHERSLARLSPQSGRMINTTSHLLPKRHARSSVKNSFLSGRRAGLDRLIYALMKQNYLEARSIKQYMHALRSRLHAHCSFNKGSISIQQTKNNLIFIASWLLDNLCGNACSLVTLVTMK